MSEEGKKKKPGGNGKGQDFERSCCQRLSLWASALRRDDLFWRTAMSGGRATIGARKGVVRASQFGDISSIDKEGSELTDVFCIECKFYADLMLRRLISHGLGWVGEWWEKLVGQCSITGKLPLLIARENKWITSMSVNSVGHAMVQKVAPGLKPKATFPPVDMFMYDLLEVTTAVRFVDLRTELVKWLESSQSRTLTSPDQPATNTGGKSSGGLRRNSLPEE